MRTPSDGWDPDEREALESTGLGRDLEAMQARHALSPEDQARLLARIEREARTEGGRPPMTPARSKAWMPAFAAAAAAMLVAVAVWMLPRGSDTASGARTPEAAGTAASTPSSPVYYLSLDKPVVKVSPAALTYRGSDGQNTLLADLRPGLDAFRASNYALADREFAAVAGKHARSIEVAFYQGVSRLLADNPQGAIARLEVAERLADSSFAWDVSWYRAIAEERVGNLAEARARLSSLCSQADARATTACAALEKLPQ